MQQVPAERSSSPPLPPVPTSAAAKTGGGKGKGKSIKKLFQPVPAPAEEEEEEEVEQDEPESPPLSEEEEEEPVIVPAKRKPGRPTGKKGAGPKSIVAAKSASQANAQTITRSPTGGKAIRPSSSKALLQPPPKKKTKTSVLATGLGKGKGKGRPVKKPLFTSGVEAPEHIQSALNGLSDIFESVLILALSTVQLLPPEGEDEGEILDIRVGDGVLINGSDPNPAMPCASSLSFRQCADF